MSLPLPCEGKIRHPLPSDPSPNLLRVKFPGDADNSLTERDISRPAAARTVSVFVLRDDDDGRRRRQVDQKERALLHDAGEVEDEVGVRCSELPLRFTAAHMTCSVVQLWRNS